MYRIEECLCFLSNSAIKDWNNFDFSKYPIPTKDSPILMINSQSENSYGKLIEEKFLYGRVDGYFLFLQYLKDTVKQSLPRHIDLALSEAFNNIQKYAYEGMAKTEKYKFFWFLFRSEQFDKKITTDFVIYDRGQGILEAFSKQNIKEPCEIITHAMQSGNSCKKQWGGSGSGGILTPLRLKNCLLIEVISGTGAVEFKGPFCEENENSLIFSNFSPSGNIKGTLIRWYFEQ
ncbi:MULTISPECIES: hypothetical protein [unclassified Pseudoalteromonas]|uniref:hypothetical protein n=1 Tax=unclassified Pseudoalteromonas TaxID=194690 RepID=UPI0016009D19|nr:MULTISPECIES: hypothetical protein [unclassified Pseudoalteromonas]MBB1350867.1 hypothetical protein [Pseudoalteromonas sp. SG45-3]MBB1359126.1 hypothetical protein [Pseudoalteromonas sp. SG45-6]MBB1453981.1 hypothetical protein [Pseudoalteromonas sp. SG43-5]